MRLSLTCGVLAVLATLFAPCVPRSSFAHAQFTAAQVPPTPLPAPKWEIDAGSAARFDVASVKQNPADAAWHSNVPLTEDGEPTGDGLFSADDVPLNIYIGFAYKVGARQTFLLRSELPKWALTARFDIEARASIPNPTKDQFRLMMQALLVERFNLAVHRESREGSIYSLVLDRPGKTGPNLQQDTEGPLCASTAGPDSTHSAAGKGLPATCGTLTALTPSAPGRLKMGVRCASMAQIAGYLSILGAMDRDVADGTGLPGTFDFSLEWTPESTGPLPPNFQPDPKGPAFPDAVREQLGLRLRPASGPVDVLVVDRIERLTEN